ncbi:glycoside hydrolase family 2 TIM barrel-domain containing protein [Mucilaginibacter sp.]|uniref:glycoside hydrolase family 2 TIM barrel-domain containing protein n=1 Tax=Mucilaginibacter sp. TaxID=1882438 RepID=UPI0035BBF511
MNKKLAFAFLLVPLLLLNMAYGQGRQVTNFNNKWQFTKGSYQPGIDDSKVKWQAVTLPHTWNKNDVMDDAPGYYRAACWYRKNFTLTNGSKGKKIYIYFNGANQQTEVYINGAKAGSHTGGYTRFCIDVTPYVKPGILNIIAVKVDNSFNEDIAPLTADFTFFGGIYRNVDLVVAPQTHFSVDNAANGVFITTSQVSEGQAVVVVKSNIVNESSATGDLQLLTTVIDKAGKTVSRLTADMKTGDRDVLLGQVMPAINQPHLWSPDDPYLYRVISKIINKITGRVIDEVSNPLGMRWYNFDAEKGFYLNGRPLKLIGASRHQDFKGIGNALPDSYHTRDVKLLKQMGGNFLRVAHYPQDRKVLEACDSLGILASVEIPVVNAITETAGFTENCKQMLTEMIRQNYNHPSIIIWAYMNEVLLRPKFGNDKPRQQQYFGHVRDLAAQLDSMARREDAARYTMIACHGDYNRYKQAGIIDVPMLIGWNLYQGWYGGQTADFAKFLDKFHQNYPKLPMLITEYGADADDRIRATQPQRFDKSVDYAVDFHQIYLNAINQRPFVAAGILWNLADFSSEERAETTPHINSKGILTQDRKPKDVYYFYQANLVKQPYLKISDWNHRAGLADSVNTSTLTQPLMVFTNMPDVTLTLNGINMSTQKAKKGMVTWQVPFRSGNNILKASGTNGEKSITNQSVVNMTVIPGSLNLLKGSVEINLLLGANRYYTDADANVWIPAKAYQKGSFGYLEGNAYKMPGNNRQGYGSDRDILKTTDDPIYQTQQEGLSGFRFDVPDGSYKITLCFAELTADKPGVELAYNLSNSEQRTGAQDRVFDVLLNAKTVLPNLNLAKQYGALMAVSKSFTVTVKNGNGIKISFKAQKGQPVLNAIRLKRIMTR